MSLMYGVSPQPVQAPENSNSGSRNCVPFTSSFTLVRSGSGRARKKSKFFRSRSLSGVASAMLMAFLPFSVFDSAGQISTQSEQPVQSSGATWSAYFAPFTSGDLKSIVTKDFGARSSASGAKYFGRIAACGQMSAHLLHWMQSDGSQVGISRAIPRFSHFVVPVGQVPSIGNAETGSWSPWPASMSAVTRFTKSGADSETVGGRGAPVTFRPSVLTS